MSAMHPKIAKWKADPVFFVRSQFGVDPDPWQADCLLAFLTHQRMALKSCKGPGKTALLAWLAWYFLCTRPHCKVAATSISGANLFDNLWPEMSKWQSQSPFLKTMFEWQKTRIICRQFPETWWMSARQWSASADPQKQADTLAGIRADYLLFLLDEAGGIPDSVMAAADAALSTGIETKVVMAGNPTDLSGPLYRACTSERHLWHVTEITADPDDPKRTNRVSKQWAQEYIEKYGRDNPWVLVNVFGKFPPSSLQGLLGPDQIVEAMGRKQSAVTQDYAAKILGVDCGRFGGARSVIFPRQGLTAHAPVTLRPDRSQRDWTATFAGRIAQAIDKWKADATFIDDTGGWGAGVIDALRAGGYNPIPVNFGARAMDSRYKNRRAEMHFLAAEWVKAGGALPQDQELVREATASNYWFRNGVFQIEDKEQVQVKLNGESPDLWDAFVLTFAQPVAPRTGIPWIDDRPSHAVMEREEEVHA